VTVRVRIAPSPTGNLHIGTARTAVFNWLFARSKNGTFFLRVEDTDLERSKPEYTQNILDGLTWLGLNWDVGPVFQSQRIDFYRQQIQTLLDKRIAYRCYCTTEELDQMREEQKANNQAPRYDNRHRDLTAEQIAAFEAEGRSPVIRFKIDDNREISWHDMVRGVVTWKGSDLGGDMVIARAAKNGEIGQPLYNLAVVVDDIEMGITHVIRGEDHIGNTPKQILLYEAFGVPVPEFAHTPLILNTAGQKLSKRDGVTSISDFQKMGFTAEALVNYMTLLGWSSPDAEELFTLPQAAEKFSFERVNKAGAKFDWDKLTWINGQYLRQMPVPQMTDLLIPFWQEAGYEFSPETDRPWLEQITTLIGPSLNRLDEAVAMSKVFFVPSFEVTEEAGAQLQQEGSTAVLQAILSNLAPNSALSEAEAQEIIKKVTKEQKVKKGVVMRSLRAALTGEVHGPDLIQSWLLLNQRSQDRVRLEKVVGVQNQHEPQEEAMSETPETPASSPVPENPQPTPVVVDTTPIVIETTPVTTRAEVKTPTTGQVKEEAQQVGQAVVSILSDLPDYVGGFFSQYQKLLKSVGLIVLVLLSLRLLQATLDVFNSLPLLGGLFEVVGIGYAGWFVYRYLLTSSSRQELAAQIQSLKEQVAGHNSSDS